VEQPSGQTVGLHTASYQVLMEVKITSTFSFGVTPYNVVNGPYAKRARWVRLGQGMVKWQDSMKMFVLLRVPRTSGNILTSCATASL